MIYGFDTDELPAATGALLVYAIYRSRNKRRFKTTPGMWGMIERATKAAAKRAQTLPLFIESLKPRMSCETIHPHAMKVGVEGVIPLVAVGDDSYIRPNAPSEHREFLTHVLGAVEHREVLKVLQRETAWVILLVRDRLEREKPVESRFNTMLSADDGEDAPE